MEREFPPFPRGQALVGCKVFSESGTEIGTVRDVLLGITPVEALRVAGFEITFSSGVKRISSSSVLRYGEQVVVIYDQVARKFR